MSNERITELDITPAQMIVTLSGGNMGSVICMLTLLEYGDQIDPAAWSPIAALLDLDTQNIWDADIWVFYKYICGEDPMKMLAVLRACQLGGLAGVTREAIKKAIAAGGAGIDVDAAVAAVKDCLPNFNVDFILPPPADNHHCPGVPEVPDARRVFPELEPADVPVGEEA